MKRIIFLPLLLLAVFACSTAEGNDTDDQTTNNNNNNNTGGGTTNDEPAVYYVSSAAEVEDLDDLSADDVVIWRDGTYTDQIVEFEGNATLRAESDGGVVFTGKSYMIIKGAGTVVSGFQWVNPTPVSGKAIIRTNSGTSSCVIEDCVITGFDTDMDSDTDAKWVSLYGTKNTVRNCTFMDKRNIGTLLVVWFEEGVTPSHTIENNYFTRPNTLYDDDGDASNGQETIRIGDSSWSMSNGSCTVKGNHFHNCHGEWAEIISNKSCDNLYEGNLFTDSAGTLTLRHGNNCTVRGNYFIDEDQVSTSSKSGGVRIIGEDHTVEGNYMEGLTGSGYTSAIIVMRGVEDSALNEYFQVKNATVKSNVIVSCNRGITTNYASSTSNNMPVLSTVISDNTIIMSSTSGYSVYHVTSPEPDITWSNNVIYSGKQYGITLETVSTAPSYTRPTASIEAVKAAAGASYYTK